MPESHEPKPPLWYTEIGMREAIASGAFPPVAWDLIPEVVKHLQMAFEKGYGIGFRQSQERRPEGK